MYVKRFFHKLILSFPFCNRLKYVCIGNALNIKLLFFNQVNCQNKYHLFVTYSNPMRWVLVLFPFTDGETKAQRCEGTCPRSHSSKWQS